MATHTMLKKQFCVKNIWNVWKKGVSLRHHNLDIGILNYVFIRLVTSCSQPFFVRCVLHGGVAPYGFPIYCVGKRFFMLKVWRFVENALPLHASKYN